MSNYALPKVPRPFVLVEYLQSSGTEYIDTGYTPQIGDILSFDTTVAIDINTPSNTWITGWYIGDSNSVLVGTYSNNFHFTYNLDTNYATLGLDGNQHRIRFNTTDGTYIDDTLVSATMAKDTALTVTPLNTLKLFARDRAEYTQDGIIAKVYNHKIIINHTTVRNFLPVKNTQTNEYGMYDLVTNQFYGNAGTGSFTGGDEIKQREYLESDGQYIDTHLPSDTAASYEGYKLESTLQALSIASNSKYIEGKYSNGTYYIYNSASRFFQTAFGSTYNNTSKVSDTDKHTFVYTHLNGTTTVLCDGTNILTKENDATGTSILLCGTGESARIASRHWEKKIWYNDNLILDLIPITVGNIGAMYDLVSNKIYFNAGTGSFTYGEVVPMLEVKQFVNEKVNEGLAPSGYKLLEYIQSSGTQYIDTGVKGNQTTEILLECNVPASASSIFGEYTDYDRAIAIGLHPSSTYSQRFGTWQTSFNIGTATGTHITYQMNKDKFVVKKIDGTLIHEGTIGFTGTFETVNTLWLGFAGGSSTTYRKAQTLYKLKLWDNGTLIRDYVPVQRISDNAIGMYDKVSKQFYGNSGTGVFTAGPEVKLVEYIESSGSQYIDTGFKPNNNTKWEYVFQCTSLVDSVMSGARIGYGNSMFVLSCTNSGSVFGAIYGHTTTYKGTIPADLLKHTFVMDKNIVYFDSVKKCEYDTATFQTTYNMYLLKCNNSGTATDTCNQRTYLSKIWDNDTLVRDFVPVLVGTEYAMYDKVNGVVYRNKGTGSFTGGSVVVEGGKYLAVKAIKNKNLFDKVAAVDGVYIDSTGAEARDNQWFGSDFIPVKPNTSYTISGVGGAGNAPKHCLYNSSKTYITNFANGNKTIETTSDSAYLRISGRLSAIDTTQVELGSTATEYEPYGYTIYHYLSTKEV